MIDHRYVMARKNVSAVDRVLLVCSGKGGVGKSVIASSLALALKDLGRAVGLLDLDIHGPSAPLVLGSGEIRLAGGREGLYPVDVNGLKVFSLHYYIEDRPMPVRGAVKESLVLSILAELAWGRLDYLVVDEPPGTGDEIIVTLRVLGDKAGAVLVTTPSALSLFVVKRLLNLLRDEGVRILGLVENMSYLMYEGKALEIFGRSRAEELGVRVLGRVPLDPSLDEALVSGMGVRSTKLFWRAVQEIALKVDREWEQLKA